VYDKEPPKVYEQSVVRNVARLDAHECPLVIRPVPHLIDAFERLAINNKRRFLFGQGKDAEGGLFPDSGEPGSEL